MCRSTVFRSGCLEACPEVSEGDAGSRRRHRETASRVRDGLRSPHHEANGAGSIWRCSHAIMPKTRVGHEQRPLDLHPALRRRQLPHAPKKEPVCAATSSACWNSPAGSVASLRGSRRLPRKNRGFSLAEALTLRRLQSSRLEARGRRLRSASPHPLTRTISRHLHVAVSK